MAKICFPADILTSGIIKGSMVLTLLFLLWSMPVMASPTEVVKAEFGKDGKQWHVSVTLRHNDTGWKHYANLWVVETLAGKEIGRRVLFHPHQDEQPFTRSATIQIPPGITKVRIRAGDNVEGLNSNIVLVDLSKSTGPRFLLK